MSTRIEPGSFRDREGRVFYRDGEVFRALSERARGDWEAVRGTEFFGRALKKGQVVDTELVSLPPDAPPSGAQPWVAALRHERIPFVSYPYEWSFHMLRDAAELQLALLAAALAEDFVLKDSSAYNFQWRGVEPVFIDIPSFEPLEPGEPWVGYLQFCQLFLYPLLLTAHKDVAFQPWLRGSIDGISPEACSALFSLRDRFRSGVFSHVYLQAKLQAMTADADSSVRQELKSSGFRKELIQINVRKLRRLVGSLSWRRQSSEWSEYRETHSYTEADHDAKKTFVREAAAQRRPTQVWDLGCNTGEFSLIAAEYADYVLALDADQLAVDRLYLELKRRGTRNVLPLVANFADPSPNLGWRGRERLEMRERGRPELMLALALLHHLVISNNIPLDEIVQWLSSLGGDLVIEFVHKEDPMVKKLLLNKEDRYSDYELGHFERCLEGCFEIERQHTFSSATRTIYFARQRPA